eukprot:8780298-Pyramimonas_sp.AAC.1
MMDDDGVGDDADGDGAGADVANSLGVRLALPREPHELAPPRSAGRRGRGGFAGDVLGLVEVANDARPLGRRDLGGVAPRDLLELGR